VGGIDYSTVRSLNTETDLHRVFADIDMCIVVMLVGTDRELTQILRNGIDIEQ
jgi:hypothetical protein